MLHLQSHSENGLLAQLVQSTCLTSRGSLVRIQQGPHKRNKAAIFGGLVFVYKVLLLDEKYWFETEGSRESERMACGDE